MLEMIDLRRVQTSSSDQGELLILLNQLVGQPFLFFRVSYGDELRIHLGVSREIPGPKGMRLRRGSYTIGARASTWFFQPDSQPVLFIEADEVATNLPGRVEQVDIRHIESEGLVQPGSIVLDAKAPRMRHGFGLHLILSDGSALLIRPSPASEEEVEEGEIADWEVFTPHERYLRVGPGFRWAYLDSRASSGPRAEPGTPAAVE